MKILGEELIGTKFSLPLRLLFCVFSHKNYVSICVHVGVGSAGSFYRDALTSVEPQSKKKNFKNAHCVPSG